MSEKPQFEVFELKDCGGCKLKSQVDVSGLCRTCWRYFL